MTDDDFDIRDFLPYLLNQAAEECGLAFQKVYKSRYGMLRTEWRVVFHLGRYGEMTANEICQRSRMHKTKISRAVSALEAKRFLTRQMVEADRRHELLSLTPAGRAAFSDLCKQARDHDARLLATFDETERRVLKRTLLRLANS